jgi:hypothetical protein
MSLIQPKEVSLPTASGEEKTFIISKFDCISGRELITQYPISAMPKLGDYKVNEELMLKAMCFVAVNTDVGQITLKTKELVRNHIPDPVTLMKIEMALMEYNCSFFGNGRSSDFFEAIAQKAQQWIIKTLMDLSEQSSRKTKQPSMNSEPSTH